MPGSVICMLTLLLPHEVVALDSDLWELVVILLMGAHLTFGSGERFQQE